MYWVLVQPTPIKGGGGGIEWRFEKTEIPLATNPKTTLLFWLKGIEKLNGYHTSNLVGSNFWGSLKYSGLWWVFLNKGITFQPLGIRYPVTKFRVSHFPCNFYDKCWKNHCQIQYKFNWPLRLRRIVYDFNLAFVLQMWKTLLNLTSPSEQGALSFTKYMCVGLQG